MKVDVDPAQLLNELAPEFKVDCVDYWRDFNRIRFNLKQILPLVPENGSVVDLGAGNGITSLALQAAGAYVTAVDNWLPYSNEHNEGEPSMHRTGERKAILERYRRHNVPTIETDLLSGNLPLEDATFDVAITMAVIEHLPGSPRNLLEEAKRILKPGGVLVIEVPNHAALRNRLKLLVGKTIHFDIEDWYRSDPFFGHFRELTRAELEKYVDLLDMETVWFRSSDSSFYNTKYRDGHYGREFRLNSLFQVAKVFYLLACLPFPTLQFQLLVAARKK